MENNPDEHKLYKDQILKALYENRGKKHCTASDVRHIVKIKLDAIEVYLAELIDEKMVKKDTVKSPSMNMGGKYKVPSSSWKVFHILPFGINYVENGFIKFESQSSFSKLVDLNLRTNELLEAILEASHMSNEEQQRHSELLTQLNDALTNKDDNKARNILKEALDAGKQVAAPLMVEYLKNIFIPGA